VTLSGLEADFAFILPFRYCLIILYQRIIVPVLVC